MVTNIILAIADVLAGLLGLVVLVNNPKSKVNRIFFYLALSLVAWVSTNLATNFSATPESALLWARATIVGAVLIVYFFVLFSFNFPNARKLKWLYHLLLLVPVLIFLALSPTALNVVSTSAHGEQFVPGPLYGLLLAYFPAYTILGSVIFYKAFRRSTGVAKEQARYVLFAIMFSFLPGFILNAIIPILGYPQTAIYGPVVVGVFVIFVSYAIIRHRLMNIRLIIARTIAYILLLATLAGLYGSAVFGATALFFPNADLGLSQKTLYVVLAIVLAFTFQPLRRFFEHLTDSVFFRDRYDTEEVLTEIGRILASEILLEKVLDKSLAEICQKLRVQRGLFMIFDKGKIYKVSHHGPLPNRLIVVPELKKLNRTLIVSDELPPGERKEILESHGLRLSLVLRTKDQFVGFLLLGDKLSGDIYSDQDIDLLQVLSHELAIAIVNAKAYEEISRFNATLQQKVLDATKRLRVANRNLKALDKAKDEFISMASHQLRTPLTTIKGYLSMILEGDAGKINAEQKEYLDFAFGGTQRMVSLISDLLNVSRLSAGRFVIEKQPADMVAVLEDEVRQLQSHAEAKSLKLSFEQPKKSLPPIEMDEGKTRQVIMNFIDNAIYYTKEGSVTVTLDYDSKLQTMTVKVTDTGIGVPPEAQKKLFTKFFRADNAQTVRPDGTGLGLYLAKRVVEDQGGKIIFETKMGQGSTFGFEMPLKAKDTNAKDHKAVKLPSKQPAVAVKR